MKKINLLIVTGMSGAGKSVVLNRLEDVGYHCIDNFPPKLLPKLTDLIMGTSEHDVNLAVVIDLRSLDFDSIDEMLYFLQDSHFVNVHDNYMTYKLNHHQHIPEIVQTLQAFDADMPEIQFSTSLLPVNRGIMATVYCKLKKDVAVSDIASAFAKAYDDKPFVRVQENLPELHNIIGRSIPINRNLIKGLFNILAQGQLKSIARNISITSNKPKHCRHIRVNHT